MEHDDWQVIAKLRERAIHRPRRIIFPESQDPRVVAAANRLAEKGWCVPIILDPQPSSSFHEKVQTAFTSDTDLGNQAAQQLVINRQHKGMDFDTAKEAINNPVLFAALLVRTGYADASVAGSVASTASVIRAGLYGVGTPEGQKLVSSFFLMQLRQCAITYADCGVVPDPTSEELAEIAVTAARNHMRLTGETAKVAMLSFSTHGSARHPKVDKVLRATQMAKILAPDLQIDGELQFDAAWVPQVAARKAPESNVAGQANVFVFPDLASGNIAYKITERLAGAQALGPLVQGLSKPCMDLSRGCSEQDITDVAVIASVMAGENE
ncbi:MAG: phosphate acetyltransferase [Mariniblastus sp.]|nr:phosphate acetyltransferase [Mariniblastus sp.]